MSTGLRVAVGAAAWLGAAVLLAAVISFLKRRDKRRLGREVLALRGMPDYRYTAGPLKGRWASEVLVEDLDDADDETRAQRQREHEG